MSLSSVSGWSFSVFPFREGVFAIHRSPFDADPQNIISGNASGLVEIAFLGYESRLIHGGFQIRRPQDVGSFFALHGHV